MYFLTKPRHVATAKTHFAGERRRQMPKFKQSLAQHPFHQWGTRMGGAANIEPGFLISELKNDVISTMANQYGIEVAPRDEEITIGGLFNSTTIPGVEFSFVGHADWARFLVGISKTAAIISIDVIQQGSVSSGMQRMNSAASKGAFSIGGILQKAITDQNAVETESMYYQTLLQAIRQVVESWME